MKVKKSVSFEVVVELPDDHTEQTANIHADTALRLIIANELPGMEINDCQILSVDSVTDIHIDHLEIF